MSKVELTFEDWAKGVSPEEMQEFLRSMQPIVPQLNNAQAARDKFDPLPRSGKQFAKMRAKYK